MGVPTLRSSLPRGQNVVWTAAFQLAWNELNSSVVNEPIRIDRAAEMVKALNTSRIDSRSLVPGTYVAEAGFVKDGVLDRIERRMKEVFGQAPPPMEAGDSVAVAFAYLKAGIKFPLAYFQSREGIRFRAGEDAGTQVSAFGIRREDDYAYGRLRRQVRVLYVRLKNSSTAEEFALDMSAESSPHQLIVALVPRGKTFEETLNSLERKITERDRLSDEERMYVGSTVGTNDIVLVPDISLHLKHRFTELEGVERPIANDGLQGMFIGTALARVEFSLNRGGAELKAEAKFRVKPIPVFYIADRPFLVIMRKRGAADPYFALWVDNPSILVRHPTH